jgi:hypothetical protein
LLANSSKVLALTAAGVAPPTPEPPPGAALAASLARLDVETAVGDAVSGSAEIAALVVAPDKCLETSTGFRTVAAELTCEIPISTFLPPHS